MSYYYGTRFFILPLRLPSPPSLVLSRTEGLMILSEALAPRSQQEQPQHQWLKQQAGVGSEEWGNLFNTSLTDLDITSNAVSDEVSFKYGQWELLYFVRNF